MQRFFLLVATFALHFACTTTAEADVSYDSEWEGDARDGSMSTAVATTLAKTAEREVFVRATASYLYYRTFDEGFESAVTSPGGSLEIGYRRHARAATFTASTGFEARRERWDDEEFVSADWTHGAVFAADVSSTYEETMFSLGGSHTFAGDYSWVRAGLERPVLDLDETTGLVVGWDVTTQGAEGHRSVDLGWILGVDLPARGASIRLRGGVSRQSLGTERARSSGFLGLQLSLGASD